jgi:two-component system, response regulator
MIDKKILIVEDREDHAELIKHAIKMGDVITNVDVVQDGQEALDYLYCRGKYEERNAHDIPSLILLDLHLPQLGGIDVLKELRSEKKTKFIPVVVFTSSNKDKDVYASYSSGANSFIQKPLEFKKFTEAINRLGVYWLNLNAEPPTFN